MIFSRRMHPIFILPFLVTSLPAQQFLPKVLVLDPTHKAVSPAHDYISASLGETIRRKVAERFVVKYPDAEQVRTVIRENFISTGELDTRTAAMQLGVWLRQDIVINGSYQVRANQLESTFRIHGMAEEKQLSEINLITRLDQNLFTSLDQVAAAIAEKLSGLLPARGTGGGGGLYYDPDRNKRMILAYAGVTALPVPAARLEVTNSSVLGITDRDTAFYAGFEFRQNEFFYDLLRLRGRTFWRNVSWALRSDFLLSNYRYSTGSETFPAQLRSVYLGTGPGFLLFRGRHLGVEIPLFFGGSVSQMVLTLDGLSRRPVDLDVNATVPEKKLLMAAAHVATGIRLYWTLPGSFLLHVSVLENATLQSGRSALESRAELGAGRTL